MSQPIFLVQCPSDNCQLGYFIPAIPFTNSIKNAGNKNEYLMLVLTFAAELSHLRSKNSLHLPV